MYRYFSHLRAENFAFDANEIAYVEQFLEHGVVHLFPFRQVVARNIYLYASAAVHKFGKRCLAHDASAHHASGQYHFGAVEGVEIVFYVPRVVCGYEFGGRVRLYAHIAERLHCLPAYYFLFR